MADVMAKLRNMDMYPKTKDEFRVRTMQGGVSSLFAVVVAIILVRSELKHSLAVSTHDRLFVNSSHGDGLSGNGDPYKSSVIDAIVSRVGGDAGADLCVLLLGYDKEMTQFLRRGNPGLARRFQLENAFRFDEALPM